MNKKIALLLGLTVLFVGCGDDEGSTSGLETMLEDALINYADIVLASYTDSRNDAQALLEAIETFVANPTETTHANTKQAWLNAQESYGQTEVYRFYGGPIDDEDGPEGQLNAWPLDESLIDYVNGSVNGPDANIAVNIINSTTTYPIINKTVIAELNELDGGETNVATGYHAVEFLLWGQDKVLGKGGGSRSYTDYIVSETNVDTNGNEVNNEDRRGDYLVAAAALIVDDLDALISEWREGGTYRTFFTSSDERTNSLERILNGMGKLSTGELAGERMAVALAAKSPEDEHSCFSDNTHRDIVTNAMGIQNVYLGAYKSISGTGIYDIIALENPSLADNLRDQINESVNLGEMIQAPFELEIQGTTTDPGPQRVQATITSLEKQGTLIAEVGALFEFSIDPNSI